MMLSAQPITLTGEQHDRLWKIAKSLRGHSGLWVEESAKTECAIAMSLLADDIEHTLIAATDIELQRREIAQSKGATREEIMAARTPKGSWTKAQLAEWGISWPPKRGWRRQLEQQATASADQQGRAEA